MRRLFAILLLVLAVPAWAQNDALYRFVPGQEPAWASPENPTAARGAGGIENKGAKGHAFDTIPAGGTLPLARIDGAGVIDRMWITIDDRSPERLRSLVLDIYWDGAKTPAVSVPLGDFFLHGAGEMVPMETALLASPEGRSFVSYIPMPFRRGARIVVTNESGRPVNLIFYDDPITGRYRRHFAAIFAEPRYTDLRANLDYFAALYAKVKTGLASEPKPSNNDLAAFEARYARYIDREAADVGTKMQALDRMPSVAASTPRAGGL